MHFLALTNIAVGVAAGVAAAVAACSWCMATVGFHFSQNGFHFGAWGVASSCAHRSCQQEASESEIRHSKTKTFACAIFVCP